jgi:transposase-like protein
VTWGYFWSAKYRHWWQRSEGKGQGREDIAIYGYRNLVRSLPIQTGQLTCPHCKKKLAVLDTKPSVDLSSL